MKLRNWQRMCIKHALLQFHSGITHFLCLATPGAGKTTMASVVASRLLEANTIDLVICMSPSLIVSHDFQCELERQTGKRFDGSLGSYGRSLTYQAMLSLNEGFWKLFTEYRVFVIFDEIHHCAGSTVTNSNVWGEKIISEIQGRAAYTMALTGTPWRSDSVPISLARYCENNFIHCDFSYGLAHAIRDKVCRSPSITLIDNGKITVHEGSKSTDYKSFGELLTQAECSYQSLVEHEDLIVHMIDKANQRLDSLRKHSPCAGGLIVASSVAHAKHIHHILLSRFHETAEIATYMEYDAVAVINRYKYSTSKWIISVGMISEGTNIPRLRVCCHLTRVKTELYFRQILGRILRADGTGKDKGYLYIPAEPTLVEYAHRVADDIPREQVVKFDSVPSISIGNGSQVSRNLLPPDPNEILLSDEANTELDIYEGSHHASTLSKTYEATLGLSGQFKHKILRVNGLSKYADL